MYALCNLGGKSLPVDTLLENHQELALQPICQDSRRLCGTWFCRDYGDLLRRVLPTLLTILGLTSYEFAMCHVPTLFNHTGSFQYFIRRLCVCHSDTAYRQGEASTTPEDAATLRDEPGSVHDNCRHPE